MTDKDISIPPCMIFVSKEGKWFHDGAEIIHRPIFLWMIQSLEKTEDGLFIIHLNNQKCFLEVEDTPLVVQRVDLIQEEPAKQTLLRLTLNDDSREILDPGTLTISLENVIYCAVKNRQFPARFLRSAYYQIAEYITEDNFDGFALKLNDKEYPIRPQ